MKRVYGFSLLELITVFCLIAIVTAMSLSGFKFFWQKTTTDVAASQLQRAIQLTRSEAIRSQKKAVLCGSVDQMNCSTDWKKGYLIKIDEHIVYYFAGYYSGDSQNNLYWRSFPVNKKQLEFLSTGLPNSQNGTFWFCAENRLKPGWAIVMNQTGRMRKIYPDKDGNIRDEKGVVLACETYHYPQV
jgi:type IV fimbrial biogenesis protein FimT